nr:hypothetical protein [Providencia rettgeri]
MALVKVISSNFFAGADLKKQEVGAQLEVSEETAETWMLAGLVERIEERKLEVATPEKKKGKGKSDGDNTWWRKANDSRAWVYIAWFRAVVATGSSECKIWMLGG